MGQVKIHYCFSDRSHVHVHTHTLSIDIKVEGLREPSSVVGNLKHVRIELSQMEDELSQPTHR